jgi:SAM-dependent methyltransferase
VYVDSKDRSIGGAEIRQRLALTEQRLLALKRDVEKISDAGDRGGPSTNPAVEAPSAGAPFSGSIDSLTYVAFEDQFRGTKSDIRSRVEDYVPVFAGASNVVDVGCGRGELLDALRDSGVSVRGVDISPAMVEICRGRGFDVELGDALGYVAKQPDSSLGGLIAVQVVEHFTPAYLTRFLEAAYHALKPGAAIVLETINPNCWMAFFETYIRDLTHQQPLHPETLRLLVQASGFSNVDVQFRAPVSEDDRLARVELPSDFFSPGVAPVVDAINDHANKLNRRLFSSMDYVVIARR